MKPRRKRNAPQKSLVEFRGIGHRGMAISRKELSIFVLLAACYISETHQFIEISILTSQVFSTEECPHHVRAKREIALTQWNYIIDVEVNVSSIETIQQIKSAVNSASLPFTINNSTEIAEVNITTVCNPNGTGYQCRCENQYLLSCDQCVSYGSCDNITSPTCGCINAIPPDGQFCQSVLQQNFTSCLTTTTLPTTVTQTTGLTTVISSTIQPILYMYLIEIQLNTTDVATINRIQNFLGIDSYPVMINNRTEFTGVNITTVCNPVSPGYQCRCQGQYLWSCDQCASYGSCDNITSPTCGCINAIPSDGQYCQQNFTTCPATTASPTTEANTTFTPTADVFNVTRQKSLVLTSLQFATQGVLDTSAHVRASIDGHVTSVLLMDVVTTSHLLHVNALMPFLQMDSTASKTLQHVLSLQPLQQQTLHCLLPQEKQILHLS
ncbi:hypothetical protein UPYG_G00252970 [Umbra pygmaea]|uniref:ADGRF3/5-like N-terminal domain-containing protein n=1 Tax=Umbra pygmaea TaxID=75934 RepID=A0ABD0W8R5_UMBPY